MSGQLLIAGIVVDILWITDQLIKHYFITHPEVNWGVFDFLSFHLVTNSGIAFGIILPSPVVVSSTVIILALVGGLLWQAYRQHQAVLLWGLTLIFGGGVSNLLDRIFYRQVVDYIDVSFFTVFNIADILISVGVGLLLVFFLRSSRRPRQVDNST